MNKISISTDEDIPPDFISSLPENAGIYAVGGAIRDAILGIPSRELDLLVTALPLDKLTKILRRWGVAEPVGKSFTVIKWYPRGKFRAIDVSIPTKRDKRVSSEGNPAMTVEEDLAGRDFTVNAIALDLRTDELIDPFGGREDISAKVLRAVSKNALSADPLRCLRAVYICARCGLYPDSATLRQIEASAPDLADIAPERIAEELKKIVLLPKPSTAFRLCRDWGLLPHFLPELTACEGVTQEGGWHAHDVFEHLMATIDSAPPRLAVRLAALFHDIGKPARRKYIPERDRAIFYGHQNLGERMARKALLRLMFSKELAERVAVLVRFHMFTQAQTDKGVRRFIRKVGVELLDDLFDLRFADIEAQGTDRDKRPDEEFRARIEKILSEKPPLSYKDLTVDGNDVMRLLNISAGPRVGEALEHLLQIVLDEPSKNDRETLLKIIESMKAEGA
ncbi:MAG TPA: HDIG domain-containing protein [candidate division Zixibacteria bacterium]|nr:HDIG domain-containing protein [candidate division Zixibacteria bacterium]